MLVDLDPIFRLGLKTCLDESPAFEVIAELGRASEILQRLEALTSEQLKGDARQSPVELVIWSVDIRYANQPINSGVPQLLRSRFPDIPLCVLLGQNDSWLLQELWQGGVQGCWLKDANQVALLAAMRQIASGQKVWDARLLSQLSTETEVQKVRLRRTTGLGRLVNTARQSLGNRGLREIELGISELDQLLARAGLGVWERLVLEGRFREMQMARRFVQGIVLPGAVSTRMPKGGQRTTSAVPWPNQRESEWQMPVTDAVTIDAPVSTPSAAALIKTETSMSQGTANASPSVALGAVVISENQFQTYKSALIETLIAKLSQGLQNLTSEPLEIDILTPTKRQELFFIILRLLEETIDDLRFSQVSPNQLKMQRSLILHEIWQRATADFFGKYVMLPMADQAEVQLVPKLLDEADAVESAILSKIPLVEDWMTHLIFQTPLQVNNQPVKIGSPEAMRQAETLLENLVIRVANAVVAPLLNQFGSVELVKQTFYDRRWISTREIERFRNALSWKYRMREFFKDPKNIFESQVPVLVLSDMGIRCQEVYTPRDDELRQLNGIPLLVTLALEARDAIAPPLRASFTWVGRGVVYVLTQVVGRGIGLIGRGILQGIGTAWHEARDPSRPPSRSPSNTEDFR